MEEGAICQYKPDACEKSLTEPEGISDQPQPLSKPSPTENDVHKKHQLFTDTKTKFGVIQREIERCGLPSHSQNKEVSKVWKPGAVDDKTDAGVAKIDVQATESLLGVDAKVELNLSALDMKENAHHHVPFEAMVGNVDATARAGFGLTGIGATAGISANLVKTDVGTASANLGIGVSTGAFVSPTQVTVQVLGTGVSLGEQTGISILGSGVSINIGKTVEKVANHFIHHNPHAHVKDQVDKAEHAVGIDVAEEAVNKVVVASVETQLVGVMGTVEEGLDSSLHEAQGEIKKGVSTIEGKVHYQHHGNKK